MQNDAAFVGLVGFFRDTKRSQWQIVIPRSQWRTTDPVRLTVVDNRIEMEESW
jgi:type VI secretion system protein VasD